MIGLRIEISSFVEEGQPNVVECTFIDSHGRKHSIIEKAPVVSSEDLNPDSHYPRPGVIVCQSIQRKAQDDFEIVEIDTMTPWGIETIEGESRFEVLPEQLVELND